MTWRVVFFGTPLFSAPTLEKLFQGKDKVVGVVTQPDREKGRGRKVVSSPVKDLALRHGVTLFQPERVREETFHESLKALQPDLFVVVAYGKILPKSMLMIPGRGAVNVHASLLPRFRGASPISWSILCGEKNTGVTTMMLDEGMDTGTILLQKEIPIGEEDNAETLGERLSVLGAELLIETVESMKAGEIVPVAQDDSKATYAPPLKKEDGKIDWTKGAEEIARRIRAFYPWPGAFTTWEGGLVKILSGRAREGTGQGRPGRVAWVGGDFIEVETGKGFFRIEEVQPEGKRRMRARDFLSGHPVAVGTMFQ